MQNSGLAEFFHGQHAAVVGQRVDDDGGVLAGLDNLVEIANGTAAHGAGQGTVDPDGFAAGDEVAPDQVGGGEVVVAGHRDQRALEAPCHVLHEAGLAAAGRALEQDWQLVLVGGVEDGDLVADGFVVGFFGDEIFFGFEGFDGHLFGGWWWELKNRYCHRGHGEHRCIVWGWIPACAGMTDGFTYMVSRTRSALP